MTSGTPEQDLAWWLAQLEREIGRVSTVVPPAHHLRDEAVPGTDPSGAITVTLAPDGAVRGVRVEADWRRRLQSEHVGAAVVAADSDAAQRLAGARAVAGANGYGTTVPDATAPEGRTCSPEVLADRAVAAFDDFSGQASASATFAGSGADGAVRVSLNQGRITACDVDRAWLSRQDEITLAHALRAALADAAARHAEAVHASSALADRITAVLADVKATLGEIPGAR